MLSDTVGEQITTWRRRRGWNRERLAEECAAVGMPELTPAVLTNIESGRRQKGARRRMVTVDELVVIAAALSVPPIILIAPYPDHAEIDVVPGKAVSTGGFSDWFSGRTYLRVESTSDDESARRETWEQARTPLQLLRQHNDIITTLQPLREALAEAHQRLFVIHARAEDAREAKLTTAEAREWSDHERVAEAQVLDFRAQVALTERALVNVRDQMRKLGITPPELQSDLTHLSDATVDEYDAKARQGFRTWRVG